MRQKKRIAILIVLVMLFNMFSPYSILFNNTVEAATGTLEEHPLILNNLGITQKGANKMLTVELAFTSEETLNGFDLQFKVDQTVLKPCNKNTGAANNLLAMISTTSDYYTGTLQIKTYDAATGTFHFTATEPAGGFNAVDNGYIPGEIGDPAIDTNGAGFPAYYPVLKLFFKVMDNSITDASQIPLSVFEQVPNGVGLPTGLKVNYNNASGIRVSKDIQIGGNGFAQASKTVSSIAVKQNPDKTIYDHDDVIDLTGGIITVTYDDGSTEDISMTDSGVSIVTGSPAKVNNPTVKILYQGKDTTFPITVNDPVQSLVVKTPMSNNEYSHGDTINFSGLTLEATRKSGAKETLTQSSPGVTTSELLASVNSSAFTKTSAEGDPEVRGAQIITYGYEGKTANETIIVNDSVASIDLLSQPTKTVYKSGESLNLSGALVEATLLSGGKVNINLPDGSVTIGTYSPTTIGSKQHLSISMGTITTSKTIDVEAYNYVTSSTLTAPTKDIYIYNESLDVAGGSLRLAWKQGSSTTVPLTNAMVSGFSPTTIGQQQLTVNYDVNYTLSDGTVAATDRITKTFYVEVTNPITSISVTAPTSTQTYNHGANLNLTGATINVNYAHGTPKTVTPTVAMVFEQGTTNVVNMSPASFDSTNKLIKNVTLKYEEDGIEGSVDFPITIINDVRSISMQTTPKQNYNLNESLDITTDGTNYGEILVTRAIGTPSVVSMQNTTQSALDSSTVGTKTITVSYTENGVTKTTSYQVTVADNVTGITIKGTPKTAYKYNEELTLPKIEVTKGSGKQEIQVTQAMVSGYNKTTLGNQTVTITYEGQTTTYVVNVKDYVTGVKVQPSSITGNYNDELSTLLTNKNVKYIVTYAKAGDKAGVSLPTSMITSTYSKTSLTAQNLNVKYTDNDTNSFTNGTDFQATLTVTLGDTLSSITVTKPTSTQTYNHGANIDLTGATITLNYASGKTTSVTPTTAMVFEQGTTNVVNMSPTTYGTDNKVTKTVTLKYEQDGKTGSVDFPITIINDIKKIEMHTTPKTSYNVNEALDITDGEIKVTRAIGTPSIVSMSKTTQSAFDSTTEGTKPITVSYTENGITKTTTYNVTVTDTITGITIKGTPKTAYKYNEELELPKINVTKGSGTTEVQVTSDMVSGYNKTTLGDQTVTITYGGKTTTYTVNVKDYVKEIRVSPSTVTGDYGSTMASLISSRNIKYIVTYAKAGDKTAVTLPESMIKTTYNSSSTTPQVLSVEYTDNDTNSFTNGSKFTTSFTVTLGDTITGITVTAPTSEQKYNHGNGINLTGATITVNYASGSTSPVNPVASMVFEQGTTNVVNMSPTTYGTNNKVTKTVTLKYEQDGKTGSVDFPITIINDIKKIEMHTTPKTIYNVNEALDITNGEIKVTRATGTPSIVSMSKTTQSTLDSSTEGTKTITVSYTENGVTKQTSYPVTVTDTVTGIAIKGTPKTAYKYNEELTLPKIDVTSGSGTKEVQVTSDMVSGYNKATLGNQTVTITYGGQTTTYTVNVKDYVTGIKVQPASITGNYNDELSTLLTNKNVKYIVTYAKAGDKPGVALPESMITSTYSKTSLTAQNLNVKYTDNDTDSFTNGTDFTATLTVTLGDAITSITVTPPTNEQTYKHGAELDLTGATITLNYASGDTTPVTPMATMVFEQNTTNTVNMSPTTFDTTNKLTKTVTLKYEQDGKTGSVDFPITIINDIRKIEMHTTPKTSYNVNESLDITNGDIKVTRAIGTPSIVSMSNTTQSGYDLTTEGTTVVTVEYIENGIAKQTSYPITVTDSVTSIAIKGTPKTAYKYNEELTLPMIEVTKGSGTRDIQVTSSMVTGYDKTTLGNQTVTITYGGQTTTYTVNVKDYVTGIKVQPASITGLYNDELSTLLTNKDVKYVVTYAKVGDKTAVILPESMITSAYNKTSVTAQTLNVKYTDNDTNSFTNGTDFTATLTVTLGDAITSITVTPPTNEQTYKHGAELDLTGATITLNYASGGTNPVTPATSMVFEQGTANVVDMSPTTFDTTNKLTKTVTLKYEQDGKTGSVDFPITIINDIRKIEMHTTPKTNYNVNDALDITNGEIKVTRAVGTTSIVSMSETTQSEYDLTTEGTTTVKVSYTENNITKTTSYPVTVTDTVTGIAIKGTPKKNYKYNEELTLPKIEVTSGSGTRDVQVTPSMVSGYDKTTLGNQTVTITYGGQTATYVVNVKDYVTGIKVQPTSITGWYNDELSTLLTNKNVKYVVTYAKAGDKPAIALPESMITSTYNKTLLTAQTLNVKYTDNDIDSFTKGTDFTSTLTVKLGDTVSSITVTEPTSEQKYKHGDGLDLTGATITVNYASGGTSSVTPEATMVFEQGTSNAVNMTPTTFDATNKLTKTVTLKYEENGITGSVDFQIEIINDIRKIEMFTTPKDSYNVNDALDITNGEIKVTRAVGTAGIVSMSETTQSGYDLTTEGTSNVTVSYTENGVTKTTSYPITVIDTVTGIAIKGTPKKNYKYNEELILPKIEVTSGSGTKDVQVTPSMVSGYDKTDLGNQTVTITYGGQTTTYVVNVKDYVTGVKVQPEAITGLYNDELSTLLTNKNVKYVVTYAKAGDKPGVALPESMITSSYDKTDTNPQTLDVEYTDNDIDSFTKGTTFQATLTVTIDDPIQSVTLLGTPKTDYEYDDDLDVSNLSIKVERLSGTTTIPVTDDNVSGYDKTTIGTQTVQISYDNQIVETFEVKVTDPVVDMKIDTKPKTNYRVNEALDVTEGTLKLTKKSGATETIDMTSSMVSGFDSSEEVVDQELTVTYEGFTDKYKITVAEPVMSISMNTTPKTDYKYGDNLDVEGGKINVVKSIGTKVIDIAESMVTELDGSEFDSTNMSTRDLLVTYGGQTTTYEITVRDYTVGAVLTAPSKTVYEYGEELDLSDSEIKIVTASGKETTIPVEGNSNVTVSGYEPTQVGPQTVTLTYTDEEGNTYTKTFPVLVEDNIASISIINTPETDYRYGDSLDVEGGMIRVTRTSGEYEDIPMTTSMVNGYEPEQLGSQTLTVEYEGFTDTYTVTVKDYVKDIKIKKPDKLIYKLDEKADLSGGAVVEIMASGAEGNEIPLDMSMIRDFDTSKEGPHSVIVIHVDDEGTIHAKTFGITVVDPIASVRLNSLPDKTDYLYGESLDITGATILVTKESEEGESGAGTILPVTKDMVSGYNSHKLGEQTITVTYKDEETEKEHKMHFIVNVEDYISHITVTEPDKTEYEYGDNLDLDGGTVKVITASGKVEEEVPLTASMIKNNFDNTSVGTQTINVEYKGFEDSFDVTLNDSIKGISINTVPDKTEYEYGEDLDTTGATITVVKSSGITIIPVTKDMTDGYNPNKVGTQIITVDYEGHETEFVVKVKEKVEENKPNDNNNDDNNGDDEDEKPVVKPNNKPSYKPNKPSNPPAEEITPPVEEKPVENENNNKPVVQKPVIDNTKKPTDNINDKKTETLGVKDEQDTFNGKALACLMIAICILLLLILTRRNVKVYVEENKEFVLGGKDKISKKDPKLDIDQYLDGETYNNKVKIVLNDNISEKLDGKELEIKFRGNIIKHKVKYEDKPYEFILE